MARCSQLPVQNRVLAFLLTVIDVSIKCCKLQDQLGQSQLQLGTLLEENESWWRCSLLCLHPGVFKLDPRPQLKTQLGELIKMERIAKERDARACCRRWQIMTWTALLPGTIFISTLTAVLLVGTGAHHRLHRRNRNIFFFNLLVLSEQGSILC